MFERRAVHPRGAIDPRAAIEVLHAQIRAHRRRLELEDPEPVRAELAVLERRLRELEEVDVGGR